MLRFPGTRASSGPVAGLSGQRLCLEGPPRGQFGGPLEGSLGGLGGLLEVLGPPWGEEEEEDEELRSYGYCDCVGYEKTPNSNPNWFTRSGTLGSLSFAVLLRP